MRALPLIIALLASCGTATAPYPVRERTPDHLVEAPAPSATPRPDPTAAAPYRVVRTRRCSSWYGGSLIATQREVFMCPGTIHDARTGQLVALDPTYHWRTLLARDASRTLWLLDSESGPEAHVTVELRGETVRRFVLPAQPTAATWDDATLVVATDTGLVRIDLRSGTLSPAEPGACAGASRLGVAEDGEMYCLLQREESDGSALTLVAPSGSRMVPWIDYPQFDHAGRVLGRASGDLVAFDTDGARTTILEGNAHLLDIDRDGSLLV